MKLNSKYFDSIRVSTGRTRAGTRHKTAKKADGPPCQWKGCDRPGSHRAPKGRGRDGEYFVFCVDHVRSYNASYNYFNGMSDGEVAEFQKDAITGHRPTWKMGGDSATDPENKSGGGAKSGDWDAYDKLQDPHGFFAWRAKQARKEAQTPRKQVKPLERKALTALHLEPDADKDEIKSRFK
ncbi:MAG: molecular chaperone DnaJ, partial [Alphaproteobacteria bacterium]|nr:molecular chaperone DnaJ [Alphaproteobacteria bacterium]